MQRTDRLQKETKHELCLANERIETLLDVIERLLGSVSTHSHTCLLSTLESATSDFNTQDLKNRNKELEEDNKCLEEENKILQFWLTTLLMDDS